MNCPNCGTMNENSAAFCAGCGAKLQTEETIRVTIPVPPVAPTPKSIPVPPMPAKQEIPGEYHPLSPWAYFGWQLLFGIPFVGFVLLIVMSFAPRNKNLKNFARSYWCALLVFAGIATVIVVIALIIAAAAGVGISELMQRLS